MAVEWITPNTEPIIDEYENTDINTIVKIGKTNVPESHKIKINVLSSNMPTTINTFVVDDYGVQVIGTLPTVTEPSMYGFTARVAEYNGSEIVSFADSYYFISVKNKKFEWTRDEVDSFLIANNDYSFDLSAYTVGLNGNETFKKISGTLPNGVILTKNGLLTGLPIPEDVEFSPFIIEVAVFDEDDNQLDGSIRVNMNVSEPEDDLPPVWITEEGLLGNTSSTDTQAFSTRIIATGADYYKLATDMEKEGTGMYDDEIWGLPPGITLDSSTGIISGKVTTNQIKSWPFGVIAYKIYSGTNIPSEIRRFIITSNYVQGEHKINWVDEDEIIDLGVSTVGKTVSIPIPLATVEDGSTIKYTLVGNSYPKSLKLSPDGLLSGEITEELSDDEPQKTFTFMIQATTNWTYLVRTAKMVIKKGLGKNAIKIYLKINNEYKDEYNDIKSQLNNSAAYKPNDDTYFVDLFPKIDVATLKCFDREVLASMLNFGNPEVVQFLETRFKGYSQVNNEGDSIGSYEVFYKAIDENTYQWDEINAGPYDFQASLDERKALPETDPMKMEDDAELDFNNKSYDSQVSQLVWDEELGKMVEKTFTTTPRIKYDVFNFQNVRKLLQTKIYVQRRTGYCYYDIGSQEIISENQPPAGYDGYYDVTEGNYYYVFDNDKNDTITLDKIDKSAGKEMCMPRIRDVDTDSNNEYLQFLDVSVEPLPEWKRVEALNWYPNTTYMTGQIILYNNIYYEIIQQFTTGNRFIYNTDTMAILSAEEVIEKLPNNFIPTLDLGYYISGKNKVYLNNLNKAEKQRYDFWYKKQFLFWEVVCEPIFNNAIDTFGIPFVPMYNTLEDNPDMYADKDRTFEVVCKNVADATIYVDCQEGLIERISDNKIIVKNGSTVSYTVSADGYFSKSDEYPIVNDETVSVTLEKYVLVSVRPTPVEATVTLKAIGYDKVIGTGEQSITVSEGTTVEYKIELEGYLSEEGEITSNTDITKSIMLRKLYTLTLKFPDAEEYGAVPVVKFIAGSYSANEDNPNSITVPERTTVVYKVTWHGGEPINGSIKLTRDTEINCYYHDYAFTLSVSTDPPNANDPELPLITFVADEPMEGTLTSNSIAVQGGTRVGYTVEKEGYATVKNIYENGITSNTPDYIVMRKYVYLELIIQPDDAIITFTVMSDRRYVPGEHYEKYALISYDGNYYNCAEDHIAGEEIDLSKWNLVTNKIYVPSGTSVSYSVSRFSYTSFGTYKVVTEDTTITKEMTDLEYLIPEWREYPEIWAEWEGFVKENNANQYLQKE